MLSSKSGRARLTISFPPAVLKAADKIAKRERRTKSEIFRVAFLQYEKRAKEWEELFLFGEQKAKEQGITSDEQIVQLIRRLRQEESNKKAV